MRFYNQIFAGTLISTIGLVGCSNVNSGFYEEEAVQALDLLTENIGELNSCSFTLISSDEQRNGEESRTTFKETDAYIKSADQMYFYSVGDNGRRGVWINEGELSLFLFDENQFETRQVPKDLLRTIDSINDKYKFHFPAADFFYPSLTDDLIDFADSLFLNEDVIVDGVLHKEVFAKTSDKEIFIWIDSESNLPKQFEIYNFNSEEGESSYVATFSNWVKDPKLPSKLFEFSPPENAVESELLKRR